MFTTRRGTSISQIRTCGESRNHQSSIIPSILPSFPQIIINSTIKKKEIILNTSIKLTFGCPHGRHSWVKIDQHLDDHPETLIELQPSIKIKKGKKKKEEKTIELVRKEYVKKKRGMEVYLLFFRIIFDRSRAGGTESELHDTTDDQDLNAGGFSSG